MRRMAAVMGVVAVVGVVMACGDLGPGGEPVAGTVTVRVAQASQSADTLAIDLDGIIVAGLVPGQVTRLGGVQRGPHVIKLIPPGSMGSGVARAFTANDYDTLLVVARDSGSLIVPAILADTGAIVPPGKSKVRWIHAAALAPAIDIWRTQPDWPAPPYRVMFPFAYGAVSPYLQSDPGQWTTFVTPADQTDTLYTHPAFTVADGKRATVIIMDSSAAGGITAIVVNED